MIYLDHAAATPVSPKALQAMEPYFSELFFNPSAPYLPAKRVREAYEAAKDEIAHAIGAKGADLVITAGATESINLAFTVCAAKAQPVQQTPTHHETNTSRALVLATEHAAVLAAAQRYGSQIIAVDRNGLIQLDDLKQKLSDEIILVSVSLANNELGTIQPLSEIAEIIRTARAQRLQRGITTPLYLHTDASQAANLLNLNVARLGVDLLTLNAAKCGGPKGVGALYVARGIRLQPLTVGGGQERGLRSGTENVPGVIGFAAALSEAQAHSTYHLKQYQEMASTLRRELAYPSIVAQKSEKVNSKAPQAAAQTAPQPFPEPPEPLFLGDPNHQLANFVPVCFQGIDAERLIYRLESEGVLVSTGAACAANKGTKSHVLAAIGLSDAEIAGSLRISLGNTNNFEQIRAAAQIINRAVYHETNRLRHDNRTAGADSQREGIKEQPAGCEERGSRKDGLPSGSREPAIGPEINKGGYHA